MKPKLILLICMLIALSSGFGWVVAGPKALATVSGMEYKETHYHFTVGADKVWNEKSRFYDSVGIIVAVTPDQQPENASAFSDAYLAESSARANNWLTERSPDQLLDILLVFSHPLTLDEANQVLKASNATAFESGIVGFAADGTPFASYSIEYDSHLRPRLVPCHTWHDKNQTAIRNRASSVSQKKYTYQSTCDDTLDSIMFSGITDEDEDLENAESADVRGYMSLRVWVDSKGLQYLLDSELVQVVDTTPQAIRDQLAVDRHWKGTPITHLALEMPVWAYSWDG